jgi:hypothetical protein
LHSAEIHAGTRSLASSDAVDGPLAFLHQTTNTMGTLDDGNQNAFFRGWWWCVKLSLVMVKVMVLLLLLQI